MATYTDSELNALEPCTFWMPAGLSKSVAGSGSGGKRLIEGIASTEDLDAQNERVLQEGIDFEPLLRSGFLNFNHSPGPENLIGQPLEARLVRQKDGKSALFVKGMLFTGQPRADAAWNLMNVLEKARAEGLSDRRLGWSVEGGVLERRGNLIARSVVRQLALTHEPVAYGTFADLAKSLAAASNPGSSTGSAAPLLLQNLQGGRQTRAQVCLALYGKEPDKCQDQIGRFKKGRGGMLEHLVLHQGWDTTEARDFLIDLFTTATT
jgi:hypothetical protein